MTLATATETATTTTQQQSNNVERYWAYQNPLEFGNEKNREYVIQKVYC